MKAEDAIRKFESLGYNQLPRAEKPSGLYIGGVYDFTSANMRSVLTCISLSWKGSKLTHADFRRDGEDTYSQMTYEEIEKFFNLGQLTIKELGVKRKIDWKLL